MAAMALARLSAGAGVAAGALGVATCRFGLPILGTGNPRALSRL